MALAKFVPVAKSTLEMLVFSVKGMCVLNNSSEAFWMGNLINKDTKGRRIEDEVYNAVIHHSFSITYFISYT